jgi:hypothetical protein
MPRHGYNTNPKKPVYNYELRVLYDHEGLRIRGGQGLTVARIDFTGTAEEAWDVAHRMRELELIKQGVNDGNET